MYIWRYFLYTALHVAVTEGHYKIVELLVKNKVQTSVADSRGRMPIHLAAICDSMHTLKLLGKTNPRSVNLLDNSGKSVLHYVSLSGNLEMVKYLVTECRADVNLKGSHKGLDGMAGK